MRADVDGATVFAEVTFAVKVGGGDSDGASAPTTTRPTACSTTWPASPTGTKLEFRAIVNDLAGNSTRTAVEVVGRRRRAAPSAGARRRGYAVVHYQRPAGDYDGWGLHVWGDVDRPTEWPSRSRSG